MPNPPESIRDLQHPTEWWMVSVEIDADGHSATIRLGDATVAVLEVDGHLGLVNVFGATATATSLNVDDEFSTPQKGGNDAQENPGP